MYIHTYIYVYICICPFFPSTTVTDLGVKGV